ncbi:MAG: UDP-2,3-diacylglucosamine diphosphatase [Saprospiraceae bacterium]|nr:UDP-2,3-diacylglucosamine diphosphatase [Saprospiraceae bacterium]
MRDVEIVVLSDLHLGTFGCHAKELVHYLKNIRPKKLILNGDIVDIWYFKKRYFPKEHFQVVETFLEMLQDGVEIYYLTGNHDDMLRRLSDLSLGKFKLLDKLVLKIDNQLHWFFHGDVFDASIQHAKWIAKLGGQGYELLIRINRFVNVVLNKMGRPSMSLSKAVKTNVKKAIKYVNDFELTAAELAIDNGYDYVICGHIHQAQNRVVRNQYGSVVYLNSGDWVENLTALEYNEREWRIFDYEVWVRSMEMNSVSELRTAFTR